jgi:hypothetical protein
MSWNNHPSLLKKETCYESLGFSLKNIIKIAFFKAYAQNSLKPAQG